jgi:divalent metal cation (Fe/Co/Zn/Cd) transporter
MLKEMAGMTNFASVQGGAVRQIRRIQAITVIWMSAEAALSLYTAWKARSPALLAFGGDSVIELLSAVVVLWRFLAMRDSERVEKRAAQIAGALLFALAAFVVGSSVITLSGHNEPQTTRLGIAVLIAAAVFMPWLATKKRRLAMVTGSSALKADAAESAMCGYLSLIALAGLLVNAIWQIQWADPIAALCCLPFIVREGWEAVRGKRNCC